MATFTLRITDELNERIKAQAAQNGHSKNDEITAILLRPDFDLRIGRLDIMPGDVLVVKSEQRVSQKIKDDIMEAMKDILPGVKVLVINGNFELEVVHQNDN